nr:MULTISPECIES: helix-turn-helix domain-containing protein [unclassified Fusibacter]
MKIETDSKQTEEIGTNRVNDVLNEIVLKTVENAGKPIAYMSKEEKVQIVKNLNDQGAFLIKGAIDYVAMVLCVSRYTIYNYLDEIRVEK